MLPSQTSTERRRPFPNGEDVVVVFPSGRQVIGRTDGAHGRARVWVDLGEGCKTYPWSWVYAWEDAPEPPCCGDYGPPRCADCPEIR